LVARRALNQHGYLDPRSYLKTPRIFGFHGVYKRLATRLRIVDVHLDSGPNAKGLVDAWARGLGLSGISEAKPLLSRWSAAVKRGLAEKPPRTKTNWSTSDWTELADAFALDRCGYREKRYLRDLLLAEGDRRLGALATMWQLLSGNAEVGEEAMHHLLEKQEPVYAPLIQAIRAYETFARSLQDAFDVLKGEASELDAQGFDVTTIGRNADFKKSVKDLHKRFEAAHRALGEVTLTSVSVKPSSTSDFVPLLSPWM
jgi:hypothetical protein